MRAWGVLTAIMIAAPAGQAGCGGGAMVRDWSLHRAWQVQRNCAHPERPAVLVEVPWSAPAREKTPGKGVGDASLKRVTTGMRVTLYRHGGCAEIHLSGTALTSGDVGQVVAVKAGMGSAILHGWVRGAGLVEIDPEKGGR